MGSLISEGQFAHPARRDTIRGRVREIDRLGERQAQRQIGREGAKE